MRLKKLSFICMVLVLMVMMVLTACGMAVEMDNNVPGGLNRGANDVVSSSGAQLEASSESNDESDGVDSSESNGESDGEDSSGSNEEFNGEDSSESNGESDEEAVASDDTQALGKLTVHFIDVGQGDATLIQATDFTMLIDAGRHNRSEVVPYLEQAGVEEIDILVGTHPHADHIGQMDKVLQRFPVEEVWMSGDTHSSRTFERVLDAILDSGANYVEPRAGDVFQIGEAKVTILNPAELTGDLNGGSIVMHFVYGDVAFMFTGDAEAYQEDTMIGSGLPLQAQILKLGHHGSSTSTTQPFIENVLPELAIYSAGVDNSYGHPHDEVIERLERMNIPVYGTDEYGTLIVVTDGVTYELMKE